MIANAPDRLRTVLWQGALLLLGLLIVFTAIYALVYQVSWGRSPHWIEAFQDRGKLPNWAENRRWLWIHQDTQYWIVRVRFDDGPVTLEGAAPHARYWSVTYYDTSEENESINLQDVQFDENGQYQITFTKDPQSSADNQIQVRPEVKRGVIEYRLTIQEFDKPVVLPTIRQNGEVLVEGRP